ncbi:hypothetical protein G6F46_008889 [Rhizopus delemar]|nr:hypothetical protein G6F55_003232 [Rhizopus delemar]KAG1549565.1 hypothetical protein G6F51_002979 [Rhizopus arrhizus]KAG1497123.1 hypothetical protein G6F54_005977 [Rhizopus delemar]KAG1507332.1 hypothetical protein G6F53_009033 [Rhizopus delemar]KAG1514279.1 hypothetical protein G6F52_009959 [Rhizopus delemar]
MNNKVTLTLKSFADEFGLLDKRYVFTRCKNIINTRHLSSETERLESELTLFKQSEEYKLYWLERSRRRTQLDTHDSCAEYVQSVIRQETTAITFTTPTSTATSDTMAPISHTTSTITDTVGTADTTAIDHQDIIFAATDTMTDNVKNTTPLEPWIFQGTNVARIIHKISTSCHQND